MGKESKVYTKTGDDGTTGLVGGTRVKKYDDRLEAYGTVDELNAAIGLLRSYKMPEGVNEILIQIQNKLFNIGSRLASDEKGDAYTIDLQIKEIHIEALENAIDNFEKGLPKLTYFILPGGEIASAQCHIARTICRRAERRIVEFSESYNVQNEIIRYMNRLSDFLFVLARMLSFDSNIKEENWKK